MERLAAIAEGELVTRCLAGIVHAVEGHRGPRAGREGGAQGGSAAAAVLAHLITEADGRSRACFACAARDACYWSEERKNLSIDI